MTKLNSTKQVRRSARIATLNKQKEKITVCSTKPKRARRVRCLRRNTGRQLRQLSNAVSEKTNPPEVSLGHCQKQFIFFRDCAHKMNAIEPSKTLEKQIISRRHTSYTEYGPKSNADDDHASCMKSSPRTSTERGTLPQGSSSPSTPPEPVFDKSKHDGVLVKPEAEMKANNQIKQSTPVILSQDFSSKHLNPQSQPDASPCKPPPPVYEKPQSSPPRHRYEDSTTYLSHPLSRLPLRSKPSLFQRALKSVWRSTCAMAKSIFQQRSDSHSAESETSWSSRVPYWP